MGGAGTWPNAWQRGQHHPGSTSASLCAKCLAESASEAGGVLTSTAVWSVGTGAVEGGLVP